MITWNHTMVRAKILNKINFLFLFFSHVGLISYILTKVQFTPINLVNYHFSLLSLNFAILVY